MHCPNCNAPIDEDTVFCGHCGKQVAPLYARGATVAEATEKLDSDNRWRRSGESIEPDHLANGNFETQYSNQQTSIPRPYTGRAVTPPGGPPVLPRASQTARNNPRSIAFLAIILALLVVGISAGVVTLLQNKANANKNAGVATVGVAKAAGASGLVSFSDSQGNTNSLKINITGLNAPPAGSQYDAWLVNVQTEQTLALGTLTAQGPRFALTFTDKGANLLSLGDKVEVTLEKGDVQLPTGNVVLSVSFPTLAFVHIKHLLLSFPTTPHQVGLLVGLREQAQLLNAQALLMKGTANNPTAVQCAAQSILDIIEGTKGQHAAPLSPVCQNWHITLTGDGFGMLGANNDGYVATSAAHASLAATQSDSTDNIKVHAHHVEIAMDNLKGWLTTIDQDALNLLKNPGNMAKVQEITTLSDHTLNGVDLDDDESVDPVPGEAGTITAYIHGQLMAALTLAP